MSTQRTLLQAAAVVLVAALLAGCTTPRTAPTTSDANAATASLTYRDHPVLGPVLADGNGRTLYIFTNDGDNQTRCYDQCASNWPPLRAEATPSAPADVAGRLSLVDRTDGGRQVAYDGRPLYYFVQDQGPAEFKGDGVNGIWFVVRKPLDDPSRPYTSGSLGVTTETPQYHPTVNGYYARPNGTTPKAGIVLIHEWWGLNENIRSMARLLASHGWAVLAVDLYRGQVATTPQQAQVLAQAVGANQGEANANMRAAAQFLRDRGVEKVVGFGWCFGGGQSYQLAISGERLAATVIYYGPVDTNASRLAPIQWPVLGVWGENDTVTPPSMGRAFHRALDNRSVENDVYVYPDVGHAFANPTGDGFAPEPTADAWLRTLDFLRRHAAPS